jgi:hypothetical protein
MLAANVSGGEAMATVTWSVKAVPGQTSQAAPVLAVFGNQLHMVYLGEHDNRIRYAVFPVNGTWSPQGPIGDQTSQAVPDLAALGLQLHMVYLGEHSNQIYHSIATIT